MEGLSISDDPKTFEQLFQFYYNFVKLLYSSVQTENVLPTETLFELNAAFDHVSRYWFYDEPEEKCVAKAYSHLKRSCLDIFKLELKKTRDQFEELKRIDLRPIDNGTFEGKMRLLFAEIQREGTQARRLEGQYAKNQDEYAKAFDLWLPVFEKCIRFQKEFYEYEHIDWARKRGFWKNVGGLVFAVLTGALATAFLENPLARCFNFVVDWGRQFFR